MLESDVFTRTKATAEIISDAKYNLAIGIVLYWFFL